MADYQNLLAAASQLPLDDRLRLIDDLVASVPDDYPPSLSDAWVEEIERRSLEIESGSVATESWTSIRKRIFEKHGIDGGA